MRIHISRTLNPVVPPLLLLRLCSPGPAVVAFVGSAALRLKAMLLGKTLSLGAACLCSKVGIYIATMLLGMVVEQRLLQDTAPSRA